MFGYLAAGILAIVVSLAAIANSRWAARQGWVYNKHNPRPSGSGIPPGTFDQIFQPSIEHIIEEQASERVRGDQDESGDKPTSD